MYYKPGLASFLILYDVTLLTVSTDAHCGALSSHLDSKDAKDNEEGTADDDDVPDRLERRHQCLYHQLQPRSSADHAGTRHRTGC